MTEQVLDAPLLQEPQAPSIWSLLRDVVVGAGAKILGPIFIGARVRVGANSVVVKDSPPDCTLVGVPARVISQHGSESEHPAGTISLDHNRLPDPVAKSIHCLIERIDTLERKLRILRGVAAPPAHEPCQVCSAGDLCCDHAAVPPAPTFPFTPTSAEAHHG
jgi:serine O-acetyltransferase